MASGEGSVLRRGMAPKPPPIVEFGLGASAVDAHRFNFPSSAVRWTATFVHTDDYIQRTLDRHEKKKPQGPRFGTGIVLVPHCFLSLHISLSLDLVATARIHPYTLLSAVDPS